MKKLEMEISLECPYCNFVFIQIATQSFKSVIACDECGKDFVAKVQLSYSCKSFKIEEEEQKENEN